MDRSLWTPTFSSGSIPPWPCPACCVGTLGLNKSDYNEAETRDSRVAHDDDFWEPDWQRYRFVALFSCNRRECREVVAAFGEATMTDWDPEAGVLGWEQRVLGFHPAPRMIALPEETPDVLAKAIDRIAPLYWSDPVAAGNRIRSAVEILLDHMGVRKTQLSARVIASTGRRRRRKLSLHERIVELEARDRETAEHLLAIKWLGNDASHGAPLTQEDVLDGLELLEEVLEGTFGDRRGRIQRVKRELIRRRGRRSR